MKYPRIGFTALALGLLINALPGVANASAKTPGTVFKDCNDCPEMVVLPAGSFTMGTPEDEVGRQPDEGPMHQVTFHNPFAISRHFVLVKQWNAFLKDTGYQMPDGDTRPGRECKAGKPRYPQGPTQPAVCMDLPEAQAYIAWLSKKTGKVYRLVSESVREYAARAGSTGPFPFPFDEGKPYSIAKHANTYGAEDGYNYTSPAGAFAPNAFGVYDMHGNVAEFVADCAHDNYKGAPTDGSAWTEPNCELMRMRGNDYTEAPIWSRSGNRNTIFATDRGDWLGFRVVRDL
ncbi:Hercynine oxygenase [compost metagenome]